MMVSSPWSARWKWPGSCRTLHVGRGINPFDAGIAQHREAALKLGEFSPAETASDLGRAMAIEW
jgi:hypothetical protein